MYADINEVWDNTQTVPIFQTIKKNNNNFRIDEDTLIPPKREKNLYIDDQIYNDYNYDNYNNYKPKTEDKPVIEKFSSIIKCSDILNHLSKCDKCQEIVKHKYNIKIIQEKNFSFVNDNMKEIFTIILFGIFMVLILDIIVKIIKSTKHEIN
jgi:hypothetical protein